MGHEDALDEHLASAGGGAAGAAGSRRAAAPLPRAQPADDVDRELQRRLQAAMVDGTLAAEVALWKLDAKEVVLELLGLASCPVGADFLEGEPALSVERTPRLHSMFVYMLFVGFAHNLLLESYVSRKSQLERIHLNVGAQTLDHLFMYRARQTAARQARLVSELRTAARGGKRPEAQQRAAAGKGLRGSANRSKAQQRRLLEQTEAAGAALSTVRVLKRRKGGIAHARRQARTAHLASEATLVDRVVGSLAATCVQPRRAKPLTAAACGRLIGEAAAPGTVVKAARGNHFKSKTMIDKGKAQLKERRKASAAAKVVQARSRPLNPAQRRKAAALPAGTAVGTRVPKRKEPASAQTAATEAKRRQPARHAAGVGSAAAATAAAAEAESEGEGEGGEESDLESEAESETESDAEIEASDEREEEGEEEGEGVEAESDGESDREAEEEIPDPECAVDAECAADPECAALEARRAGLRKGLKIFEERWQAEHGRPPRGSDDIPFHVRASYREYADVKERLRASA